MYTSSDSQKREASKATMYRFSWLPKGPRLKSCQGAWTWPCSLSQCFCRNEESHCRARNLVITSPSSEDARADKSGIVAVTTVASTSSGSVSKSKSSSLSKIVKTSVRISCTLAKLLEELAVGSGREGRLVVPVPRLNDRAMDAVIIIDGGCGRSSSSGSLPSSLLSLLMLMSLVQGFMVVGYQGLLK